MAAIAVARLAGGTEGTALTTKVGAGVDTVTFATAVQSVVVRVPPDSTGRVAVTIGTVTVAAADPVVDGAGSNTVWVGSERVINDFISDAITVVKVIGAVGVKFQVEVAR